jgi:hypothetical protein
MKLCQGATGDNAGKTLQPERPPPKVRVNLPKVLLFFLFKENLICSNEIAGLAYSILREICKADEVHTVGGNCTIQ